MKASKTLYAIGMIMMFAISAVAQNKDAKGNYASVNGLKMYYEIHGSGQPLVLLHGSFGFIGGWATILPALTKTHQVITVELQGHGHTNDLDRPLTYEQMAEDVAVLLQQLKIKNMGRDFKGYSAAELKTIKAQALIMFGDREGIRPEHAVEMYRLISHAQLAIFPGGDHFMLFHSPEKVLATLVPFLEAPMPAQKPNED